MQTVLLNQLAQGSALTITTSSAAPIPRPPWVRSHFGWIACDLHDQVIYTAPGSPLVAASARGLTKRLIKSGLVLHIDDE